MIQLHNEALEVQVNPMGAELVSCRLRETGTDYMWNGNPAFWGKHSPVLFPIVGTLKNNRYFYQGKAYELPRHGFAREKTFSVNQLSNSQAIFTLVQDESTLALYPFPFRLSLIYTLSGKQLRVGYEVENTGADPLYFSLGAHPAFAVPLQAAQTYSDYYLLFEQNETAGRWPISPEGLIEKEPLPLFQNARELPLSYSLFQKDALVLKQLRSAYIEIRNHKDAHGLRFAFNGFPFFGIWAAKNADFVCLEPWCGIADSVDTDQELINKEGIECLAAGALFEREWSITLF